MIDDNGIDTSSEHDCERCYEPATAYVRDVRMVGWTEGIHPVTKLPAFFKRWEFDGPVRYFCHRHKREPRVFDNELVQVMYAEQHPDRVWTEAEARAIERHRLGRSVGR